MLGKILAREQHAYTLSACHGKYPWRVALFAGHGLLQFADETSALSQDGMHELVFRSHLLHDGSCLLEFPLKSQNSIT